MIIQGSSDEQVPLEFTRKAFNTLPKNENNRFIEISNTLHSFEGEHLAEFIKHSVEWLRIYFL
ncbi:MAG: hypothetical protein ACFFB0_17575 [Promethearchaeota archaeon]